MFKALSPGGFFTVVIMYFILLLGITIWSSTYDTSIDVSSKEALFILKVVQVISVLLVFILPACLFVLLFTTEKLTYFMLDKFPSFLFIVISCLLIVCATPFISYLQGLNERMTLPSALSGVEQWMKTSEAKVEQIEEAFMKDQTAANLATNLFVIAFMAALSEELLFRGLLQKAMLNYTRKIHLSVWSTAILFSAFHMQFYGFIPRMLLGAILGYIYVWSGSLWTSIIVHFMNNALVLVLSYLVDAGILSKTVKDMGMEGDSVTLTWAIPSIILTIAGIVLLNKVRKPVKFTA